MNWQTDLFDDTAEVLARAAVDRATTHGEVTADDLHVHDTGGRDSRIYGKALAICIRRGWLTEVGWRKSRRSECHHRRISVFALPADVQTTAVAYATNKDVSSGSVLSAVSCDIAL